MKDFKLLHPEAKNKILDSIMFHNIEINRDNKLLLDSFASLSKKINVGGGPIAYPLNNYRKPIDSELYLTLQGTSFRDYLDNNQKMYFTSIYLEDVIRRVKFNTVFLSGSTDEDLPKDLLEGMMFVLLTEDLLNEEVSLKGFLELYKRYKSNYMDHLIDRIIEELNNIDFIGRSNIHAYLGELNSYLAEKSLGSNAYVDCVEELFEGILYSLLFPTKTKSIDVMEQRLIQNIEELV